MAFDVKTFRVRTASAILFMIIMFAGLLLNRWGFFLLFSIIHFGCWMEYQKLIGLIDKEYQKITPFHKYGVMIAGWCIMLYFTNDSYQIFGMPLHELGWWTGLLFVFILPIMELLFTMNIRPKNIGYSAFGLVYISLSLGLMMDLYNPVVIHFHDTMFVSKTEWIIPAVIIISIWMNDTMAYLVGSLIGRTPMTKISPKKTWEGTIGGVILSIGIVFTISYFWANQMTTVGIFFAIVAAVASITGTFGDLLESKLKRMSNVKDSGTLMPGHGGFLDRFDSMLVAIPFVWLLLIR